MKLYFPWKYIAKDKNGEITLFQECPYLDDDIWISYANQIKYQNDDYFNTMDYRESLHQIDNNLNLTKINNNIEIRINNNSINRTLYLDRHAAINIFNILKQELNNE